MTKTLLFALSLFAASAASAAELRALALCGASLNGETLPLAYNSLTGRYSTPDSEERVLFFLDVTRVDRIRLAMVETLPNQPRRFTQMWIGYTMDIAHLEFSQDGYELSISCQRQTQTPEVPAGRAN